MQCGSTRDVESRKSCTCVQRPTVKCDLELGKYTHTHTYTHTRIHADMQTHIHAYTHTRMHRPAANRDLEPGKHRARMNRARRLWMRHQLPLFGAIAALLDVSVLSHVTYESVRSHVNESCHV